MKILAVGAEFFRAENVVRPNEANSRYSHFFESE